MSNVAMLKIILNSNLAFNPAGKAAFHSEAENVLTALAEAMGLSVDDYEIESHKYGEAVSGTVALLTERVYIRIFQSIGIDENVVWREAVSRDEFAAGENNYENVLTLLSPDFIGRMIDLQAV